jgi:probable F420-dependent oxidoreductase
MRFGIAIFATDTTIQPVQLARAVEERGFESLWLPEHSHIPVSRRTPWGGVDGAPALPEKYWRCHDSLVALAAAAAVTERIKLCTGITLLAQRDPIWTAKEVASLDVLSSGRVVLGLGYGWNKEEMASHGVRYGERRALLREKVILMKRLWTEEEASFEGDLVRLEASWAWPKPAQHPHPPLVLGAAPGPRMLRDLVEWADGWMPLGRYELEPATAAVMAAAAEAGRPIELTYFQARPTREFLARLAGLGFQRAVFMLDSAPAAEVIDQLDGLTRLVDAMGGHG